MPCTGLQVKVLDRQTSSKLGIELFGEDAETSAPPLTDVEVVIIKDRYTRTRKLSLGGGVSKCQL